MDIIENLDYIKLWLEQARQNAMEIASLAKAEKSLAIFTISTTQKVPASGCPYLTPIRKITHGFIGGAVVFSQSQAIILARTVDGIVEYILVDAEKKLSVSINADRSPLQLLNLRTEVNEKSRFDLELGNLSAACYDHIKTSHFVEFKPNDLTCEAVWLFLSEHFRFLSGRKMTIIGAGNIGFKIALKLVECGVNTHLVRRDLYKGMIMANAINILKPESTVARAHFNSDPIQASLFSDAIIGCTEGAPVISWRMIECISKNGIIIDVGKGTIHPEAITNAFANNISIFRTDVACALDGAIAAILYNKENLRNRVGRQEILPGIHVVSGGFMGRADDIVVDFYRTPHHIIGICNGLGDFKQGLTEDDQRRISLLRNHIQQR